MNIFFKLALSSLILLWSLLSFVQTNKVEYVSGKIEGVAPKVDQYWKIFREVKVLCKQNNRERLEYFVFEDSILIIRDDSGMEYKIYPDGKVVVSSYLDISNDVLNANGSTAIVFQQNTTEKFGFDPKEHMEWADQYELIKLLDNSNYFVPNKSLGENEGDKVDFKFNDSLWTASDIYFKLDNDSLSLLVTATGNLATVTLPSNLAKGKYKFYAMADGLKLGKLNLEVFEEKTKEVVVVPLVANYNYTAANIEAILESTFGEANVKVDVTLAGQWNDAVFTTSHTMQVPEEVGLLNKYSQEMRDLRDAYFDDTTAIYKEKAYYLFVVPSFSDPNLDGYMVRGKGLGFVANNADLLVYAHELGHGIGALEHSWNENGPAQGSTNNLMDYAANAKELTLDQWKELRSFDVLPSLMDEVEDAQIRLPMLLETFNLVGSFCMADMKCLMKKYFVFNGSNTDALRYLDTVRFNQYSDSSLTALEKIYFWKYNGSGNSWTFSFHGTSGLASSVEYIDANDTLACDGRITSYCDFSGTIIIPPIPPKVFDYLVYVAYPLDKARPGINDNSAGAILYRLKMGDKAIQVGHTGVCLIKCDTVTKKAKVDYYDFGRFIQNQSALGNGVRRHYDLGYLNIFLDTADTTYKLSSKDSINIKINQIPYFAGHQDKYGRKEIAIAPISKTNMNNAESLALSSFYEVCTFGFGENKSFCTDFVHDVFTAGGEIMADISSIVSDLNNRLEMANWLKDHNYDENLMNYWDSGSPFLRDISKSPLPINYAIMLKLKYPKFN